MSIVRSYRLTLADGAQDSLRKTLDALESAVATIDGFEGAELLQDLGDQKLFEFRETWTSLDHHARSGALIPRHLFKELMQCLASPPEATTMALVPIR